MYDELVKNLRKMENSENCVIVSADGFPAMQFVKQAADAIEELQKAAKAMHTWIFLNSWDEQAAYDECGLTDEINIALGYGGQIVVKSLNKDGE